jgi:hypothetical protein
LPLLSRRQRHCFGAAQRILYTLFGMKTLWQHTNGQLYAVDHDSFGHIIGAVGPLDPDNVRDLAEYRYGPGVVAWIKQAIERNTLRRINP